jgi:APA family basic amino acid/polyamine antiporter
LHANTSRGSSAHLKKILGLGFGLAVIFGGTVGVGILRLPGLIAGQLGSPVLILGIWVIGAAYALLGAMAVAELGTMMPTAGGFYLYSRRAFGPGPGFVMGWADWLNNCAVVSFAAVTAAEYLGRLWPVLGGSISGVVAITASEQRGFELNLSVLVALVLLAGFCALHMVGIKLGSTVQQVTSSLTALTFLILIAGCFFHRTVNVNSLPVSGIALAGLHGWKLLVPIVAALRAIVVAYDGWYEAIYFTEEDVDAAHHLPRAMIFGVAIVLVLYLMLNLAFLRVLTIPALAVSTLPAADAAGIAFGASWAGVFVTVLSLMTMLSVMNAVLLGAPRILVGVARDGLLMQSATHVAVGGTPRMATISSAAICAVFIMSGRFEEIIAVAAILIAGMYTVNYLAVIVLRIREPHVDRPFKAWGFPVTTVLVLAASLGFLIAAVHDDAESTWKAAVLMLAGVAVYAVMKWKQRRLTKE